MSRLDRTIGIVLGILLGVAIVIIFVFLGSEETIDAPSIEGTQTTIERPAQGEAPSNE